MSTPRTEAGRALARTLSDIRESYYPFDDYADSAHIEAIEQEAVARFRAEAIAALEGLYYRIEKTGPLDYEMAARNLTLLDAVAILRDLPA